MVPLIYYSLFVLLLLHSISEGAPEEALITQLPGFNGTFPSKHYSGFVTIDESKGKNLFYYFVLSEGNPTKDPLVLWLNGGPGCSSFDGFVYEHGPFNFQKGRKPGSQPQLHLNPYSWSKVSSIIYLDSPAGVGFSYSNDHGDYITGDLKTASDTHTFLLKWFQKYPEFLANPFYISGESYAGVYVPTLAFEVANGIKAGVKPMINFKGYMVGNGVTDTEFDGNALVPFAHGMGLISDDLFQEVNAACQGNYWNPTNEICEDKLDKVDADIRGLNIYDILEPCYHSPEIRSITSGSMRLPTSFRQLGETKRPLAVRKRMFGRAWPLRASVRDGYVPTWPQLLGSNHVHCTDDEVATTWLNDEKVRSAIHAQQKNVSGDWELCTGNINLDHDAGSMIKYHKNLTAQGYRAVIFRGGKREIEKKKGRGKKNPRAEPKAHRRPSSSSDEHRRPSSFSDEHHRPSSSDDEHHCHPPTTRAELSYVIVVAFSSIVSPSLPLSSSETQCAVSFLLFFHRHRQKL